MSLTPQPARSSVVVVGGGVIGLMTARELATEGHKVIVVDPSGNASTGCSYGNQGILVPSHFVPLAAPGAVSQALRMVTDRRSAFRLRLRADPALARWGWTFLRAATAGRVSRAAPVLRDLHLRSRALYEQLDGVSDGAVGLRRTGLLMLAETARGWHEEQRLADHAVSLGIPTVVMANEDVQRVEPEHRINAIGAVKYPLDCRVDPRQLMRYLCDDLRRRQVEIVGAEVTGWVKRHGIIEEATTALGGIGGEQFVIAAGARSQALAHAAGLRLLVEPGRGYSLTVQTPRQPHLRHCAILAEAKVAVTPLDGELRVGGTMELVGYGQPTDQRRIDGVVEAFSRAFPDYPAAMFRGTDAWSGLRPCSPDGLPYLGRSGCADNLLVATGHGMMGVSMATATAELVAKEIGDPGSGGLSPLLHPDRHDRRRTRERFGR